jgi:hypothetical protein
MSLQRHKSALRLFAVFVLLVSAVALFKFSDINSAIAPIALTRLSNSARHRPRLIERSSEYALKIANPFTFVTEVVKIAALPSLISAASFCTVQTGQNPVHR